MRGLYIHIPFCKKRCHYCNFISISNPTPALRERFFHCLINEINEAHKQYGCLKFNTLYFGGGSPSLLSVHEMTELMQKINDSFEIAPDAEITCEWNPGDDHEKFALFEVLGINRISLGAQSFSDTLLTSLGRRHATHDTFLTINKIKEAGISNISLDLMVKLPGQTVKDFQESLERAINLEASQVSLYDLEVHPETVLGQLQKENKLNLPSEEEHAAMYQAAIDTLTQSGYEHYEISNFAKSGKASRHNLIYWNNGEYLGLGPGAFSYLKGIRYQFASDAERTRALRSCRGSADASSGRETSSFSPEALVPSGTSVGIGAERYFQKCEAGDWKKDVQDALSDEDKETESLVTGLRLREGVEPEHFKLIVPAMKDRIEDLLKEGLLERSNTKIRLTTRGKFLSEDVFSFLLQREPFSTA